MNQNKANYYHQIIWIYSPMGLVIRYEQRGSRLNESEIMQSFFFLAMREFFIMRHKSLLLFLFLKNSLSISRKLCWYPAELNLGSVPDKWITIVTHLCEIRDALVYMVRIDSVPGLPAIEYSFLSFTPCS